jgi:hypothetical protein
MWILCTWKEWIFCVCEALLPVSTNLKSYTLSSCITLVNTFLLSSGIGSGLLHGLCVHWHLKRIYTDNSTWGKSRESEGLEGRLCSKTFEEKLYFNSSWEDQENLGAWYRHCVHRQVKGIYHENLSGSEGGFVHWYLRKGYTDVFVASNFWAKQFM